jgi:hypothetical protein
MIYATQEIKTMDERVMGCKIRDGGGREDLTMIWSVQQWQQKWQWCGAAG